ncbi:thioredoxin domain-containing protein 5-like [Limulus polyphemus]|uniref:Thioredoxin domain-containing protein 5-like n=1 Tax=Limulus polyphemus TaxID=6850 RepID=A0ABM1TR37_LIMPO|nr:thioredoxin domain-containing protein 5-like [Limulus polyphemus]
MAQLVAHEKFFELFVTVISFSIKIILLVLEIGIRFCIKPPLFHRLKFFKSGSTEGVKYRGSRDLPSLESFVTSTLGEEEVKEEVKIPKPNHGMLELTDNTFQKTVQRGQHFVKFYAPWCGHCQKLAPVWQDLAISFEYDPSVRISKVDCTSNRFICNEFEVKAYPTLLWIIDGKKVEKYQGGRSHEELKSFVTKMKELNHKIDTGNEEKVPDALPSPVVQLTSENFVNAVSQGLSFVKFFAPWCGHCRRLASTWNDLGRKFVRNTEIKIAKVDCTVEDALCSENKVEGYPTLILFRNGERIQEYGGARDLSALHGFVLEHLPREEL